MLYHTTKNESKALVGSSTKTIFLNVANNYDSFGYFRFILRSKKQFTLVRKTKDLLWQK